MLTLGTLLCAVVVLAFTLPKAYELKKDEVDSFAAKAHHHTKVRARGDRAPQLPSRHTCACCIGQFAVTRAGTPLDLWQHPMRVWHWKVAMRGDACMQWARVLLHQTAAPQGLR